MRKKAGKTREKDEWKTEVAVPGAPPGPPAAAKEAAKPPVGLECRSCGCGHFEVVYTRPAQGGRILRCRACRNCGRRIQTFETPVPEPPEDPNVPWWRNRPGR